MSTGTAQELFGAASLTCAVKAVAATTTAIGVTRRVFGGEADPDVADSDSLEADMFPVTTSDDVGPSCAQAVPI